MRSLTYLDRYGLPCLLALCCFYNAEEKREYRRRESGGTRHQGETEVILVETPRVRERYWAIYTSFHITLEDSQPFSRTPA
jgi:hypothetical protein